MQFKSQIDLKLTQESGQTSQTPWQVKDNSYCEVVEIANMPILIKTHQNDINNLNLEYELPIANQNTSIDEVAIEKEIARIFNLNFDLDKFYSYLSEDSKLEPATDFCKGLRLFLAKDPFECIVSSITSANNSIARWTKSIAKIKEKWGVATEFPSGTFYSFPLPTTLMDVYEDNFEEYEAIGRIMELECCTKNLKSCGVGYRVPYIKRASELFTLEIDLLEIPKMTYSEAYKEVLKLPGVGPKVADCILLYGYGFEEAFPSDIWIKRIASHLYFNDRDISVAKVREFGMERFGNYAGYVQLYLFHYARKSGLMNKIKE
ncbi:MAG: 3-methyladenine DNA glycosylase [Methanobacteriaceae archaeon]|jgi:N-glycosylase/DNA lyase|nr:3-methyladenine DNA glycosylase [Candidatus Methanorudis spinitermitis]